MARVYKDGRQKDLAIIHSEAKALGLDDDMYRDFLETLTGKRSAAELKGRERQIVIDEMNRLNGSNKEKNKRRGCSKTKRIRPADDRQPLVKKVYALLYALDLPLDYAESTLSQMFGSQAPAKLEWANVGQLQKLIAALEIYKRRQEAKYED